MRRMRLTGRLIGLFGFVGLFGLATGVASAQPVYNWTGFYVGAHAGYGWGDTDVVPTEGPFTHPGFSVDSDSFVLGGQFGYHFQYGNFVFGPQVRISAFTGDAAASSQLFFGPVDYRFETDWAGSLQAKAGLAFGQALFYGMGGLALSRVTASATHSDGVGFVTYSDTQTRAGLVLGLGAEYALTTNVRVGVLLQNYWWAEGTYSLGVNPFDEPVRAAIDRNDTTVRAEVNVAFGGR